MEDFFFWTTSLNRNDLDYAFSFGGVDGTHYSGRSREAEVISVRCVGR